jgi:hypothetical protein
VTARGDVGVARLRRPPGDVPDLDLRLGDEPRLEQRVPVGADRWPDQREDVVLAVVLPDRRRRQPETVPRLEVRAPAVDRRGDVVHLVVDDQPPLAAVEQLTVAVHPRGAVGRDRHRANLLLAAVVLADLVGGERGVREQFLAPLARQLSPGHENQRFALDGRQNPHRGDGLAAARRTDQHARVRLQKVREPRLLVVPKFEIQFDRQVVAAVEVALVPDGVARLVEDPLDLGDALLGHPALGVGDGSA